MSDLIIRDVWAHNLEQEMGVIQELLEDFPVIAMDTEFPGTVCKPVGNFSSLEAFNYANLRCNVDFLKIIQIGITLGDGHGNFPSPCCTWQFNFKFNLDEDMYVQNSIELLQNSGIDFARFNSDGISVFDFTQYLYTTGLVCNNAITYVTFASGYDFGYLIKMLTCKPLPETFHSFSEILNIMFPNFYDLKMISEHIESISGGGLQALANELGVNRVGPQHQAGSDALITLKTFTALIDSYIEGNFPGHKNQLYGYSE